MECRNQRLKTSWRRPNGVLTDARDPSADSMNYRDGLPAAPREHDGQGENCYDKENAELEVLTTPQKSIEVPVVLGQWHDGEQETGEQEKKATSHGVGSRESLDGSLPGKESFLPTDAASELVENGSNGEKSRGERLGDVRCYSQHRDPGFAEGSRFCTPSTDSCHLWWVRCIFGGARLRILCEGFSFSSICAARAWLWSGLLQFKFAALFCEGLTRDVAIFDSGGEPRGESSGDGQRNAGGGDRRAGVYRP